MSSSANPLAPFFDPTTGLCAVTPSRTYDYLESRPREFDAKSDLRWPLILFLHGAAERGRMVHDVARLGLPRLLTNDPELSPAERAIGRAIAEQFVIVAPQCAPFEVWNEAHLLELLDDVSATLKVDRDRVYLTGLSLGGFGAWSLGLRHPERFAALAPICGGGRIADISNAMRRQPDMLRRLGVWAFHGANDRVVPLEESERMVDALKEAGVPDVRLTVYPDLAHDSWTTTYANPELYRWFLQHRP